MQQAQKDAQSAVDELEDGHEDDARTVLRRALTLDPNNKLALSLMRQLTTDPVMLLGKESFSYTVKAGESLSRIAGHFLGDIYMFYGLARYNDIKVPKQVAGGQVIRVPGKAPAAEDREPPKPAKSSGKPTPKAGKGESSAPVSAPAPAPAPVSAPTPVATPPVEAASAPTPPVKAPSVELSPGAKAMQSAQAAERAGNLDKALADYRLAASLSQAGSANKAEGVRKQLVDRHTQKARASMARQDLDGAIANWNRVLELDPGNDMARLEKQKALTLKDKIKALK